MSEDASAKEIRFGALIFSTDFQTAHDEHGVVVQFTRAERRLLSRLASRPGQIHSRDSLLDAVIGDQGDANDRNIDFLVNRLRRKLGDSARDPAYIGTRYGEGYVWIADTSPTVEPVDALLTIGPVRDFTRAGRPSGRCRAFAAALAAHATAELGTSGPAVLSESFAVDRAGAPRQPRYHAELSFYSNGDRRGCVVGLKTVPRETLVHATRLSLEEGEIDQPELRAQELARDLTARVWGHMAGGSAALPDPSDPPLQVQLHEASILFAETTGSAWKHSEQRLRTQLEQTPGDPRAQCRLATALHSKYVQLGMIPDEGDSREQDEDEIEVLVLASLPSLQDAPLYALAAAKLLYFLDRGYREMALRLSRDAFDASTALAMSFAVHGQLEDVRRFYRRGCASLRSGPAIRRGRIGQLPALPERAQVPGPQGDR